MPPACWSEMYYICTLHEQIGVGRWVSTKKWAIFRVSVNLPEGTYFPVAMENPSVVPRALILDLCHIHLHIEICRFVSICGTYPKIISFKTTGDLEVPQFETHGPYLAGAMAYHLQPPARAVRQKKTWLGQVSTSHSIKKKVGWVKIGSSNYFISSDPHLFTLMKTLICHSF
jgi:hypothetical protein